MTVTKKKVVTNVVFVSFEVYCPVDGHGIYVVTDITDVHKKRSVSDNGGGGYDEIYVVCPDCGSRRLAVPYESQKMVKAINGW